MMKITCACFGILVLLVMATGCSSSPDAKSSATAGRESPMPLQALGVKPDGEAKEMGGNGAASDEVLERKIIRNASLDILVKDFDHSRAELESLIERYRA